MSQGFSPDFSPLGALTKISAQSSLLSKRIHWLAIDYEYAKYSPTSGLKICMVLTHLEFPFTHLTLSIVLWPLLSRCLWKALLSKGLHWPAYLGRFFIFHLHAVTEYYFNISWNGNIYWVFTVTLCSFLNKHCLIWSYHIRSVVIIIMSVAWKRKLKHNGNQTNWPRKHD